MVFVVYFDMWLSYSSEFATLEATIHKAFIELGAEIVPLNGNKRMKVLYDYYHLGDEGSFDFDIKKAKKVGADFRNDLCNGMVREKGEFMLGLCEQCIGDSLNSRQKSIIDRCVRKLYIDIARSKEKYIPVIVHFFQKKRWITLRIRHHGRFFIRKKQI